MNFGEINKHLIHKTSKEKITLEGDNFVISKYCFDCDEEYVIKEDVNNWKIVTNFTCPKCGMSATESQKYIEKDGKIVDRHWKYCFNCKYTEEEDKVI